MNEQAIVDVQSTRKAVEGIAPQVAALFNGNRFVADPSLER